MSSSEWWDSVEVYDDNGYTPADYDPDDSVRTNHALLGDMRDNDFDTTEPSYTLGLLTLMVVFLVAGLLACIFLPCCYCCSGKSRQERLAERINLGNRKTETKGGLLMVVVSIMAIACAGGAIYGLARTDAGISGLEDNTQDVSDNLIETLGLPNKTLEVFENANEAVISFQNEALSCVSVDLTSLTSLDADDFSSSIDDVQTLLEDAITDDVEGLANDVDDISDAVGKTESVRHGIVWPALALSMWAIICFIIIGLTTYGVVACGLLPCGPLTCILLPGTAFLAVVIWLCAATAVTLSAMSGDFCIDVNNNVEDLIRSSVDGSLAQELLIYYTTDCDTSNSVTDAIVEAQELVLQIASTTLPSMYESANLLTGVCPSLSESVETVDAELYEAWELLDNAAILTSCETMNGLYQEAVYENMCDVMPAGLLGFWVSCVFLTVLLLVLAVQWGLMLRRQTTDQDFEQAQAQPKTFWASTRSIMSAASTYGKNLPSNQEETKSERAASGIALSTISSSGQSRSQHDPVASGRYSASNRYVATSGRSSVSASHSVDGSARSRYKTRDTQPAPVEGTSIETFSPALPRNGGASQSADFTGIEAPLQRPVEVANPKRWSQRGGY